LISTIRQIKSLDALKKERDRPTKIPR